MSKVVHTSGGTSVVANMHWSVFLSAKKDRQIIRKTAQMVAGLGYVIDGDEDARQIGFETPDVMAVSGRKASRRSSFALLCRELLFDIGEGNMSANHNGIFLMHVEGDSDKRAICAIRNGQIVQDSVEQTARAFSLAEERHREMAGYCQVLAEHDELPITLTQEISWDDLTAYVAKENQLAPVPMSPLVPLALLALVAAIGCGTAYYFMVYQPAVEAEQARRRAEADKTPAYLKALKAASSNAGWERVSLKKAIESLKDRPYFVAGWSLAKVTCGLKRCVETWERQGGDLTELVRANSVATLLPDARLRKDVAVMERVIESIPGRIDLTKLPHGDLDTQVHFKPVIQQLDNAGIRMQLGKDEVWPRFSPRGVKKDVLVMVKKVELTAKYPFSVEALEKAPSNVVYSGFTLKTEDPNEFVITVEGNAYVR